MRAWKAAGAATIALILAACGSGADGDDGAGPAAGEADSTADDAAAASDSDAVGAGDTDADAAGDTSDADADAAGDANDAAAADGGAVGDPAAYGLDDDVTVLGIGDTGLVEWGSGISFEVTLHDFIATETLDLADFDGADFGSESYLVDLAEAGEPELEAFFVADVTLRNTGPDVPLADLASSLAVTDQADASPWGIWFAEGTGAPLATTLATGDSYAGRLVGDTYVGDHYILRFETVPDTVWVVPAEDVAQ